MRKQASPHLEAEYRKWKAARAVERKAWRAVETAKREDEKVLWEKAQRLLDRRWTIERRVFAHTALNVADVWLKATVMQANQCYDHMGSDHSFWLGYRAVLRDIRRLASA